MERIRQKIGRIKEYLKYVEDLKDDCDKKIIIDPYYRGALLHYLYLITDNCIAVAEMVIKNKNLRPPQSYSEAIDILGENGILDGEFAYSFAAIAGFRNFIAHDYDKIDYKKICKDILTKMPEVKKYIEQIETILN